MTQLKRNGETLASWVPPAPTDEETEPEPQLAMLKSPDRVITVTVPDGFMVTISLVPYSPDSPTDEGPA